MKFKTTIHITAEAKDKNEAMEIAGEYLSGHLATGVDMKVRTAPVRNNNEYAVVAIVVLIIASIFTIQSSGLRHSHNFMQFVPGNSVIQPPLKTSSSAGKSAHFKDEWRSKHTKEALDSIKK